MSRARWLAVPAVLLATWAYAQSAPPPPAPAGPHPFFAVHKVLTSPRCMNCHPQGDAPLQFDQSKPHAMGISRAIDDVGMSCATCHQVVQYDFPHAPPGAPNWHLPPEDMRMVFEGQTVQSLCEQLRDPAKNGGKTLDEVLHHVSHDPLVLWGWNPGPGRTTPPLSHDTFVGEMKRWVDMQGACPEDTRPFVPAPPMPIAAPAAETPAATDAPATDTPAADTPATDTPATDTPAAQP